jgi:hypothetical protein
LKKLLTFQNGCDILEKMGLLQPATQKAGIGGSFLFLYILYKAAKSLLWRSLSDQ